MEEESQSGASLRMGEFRFGLCCEVSIDRVVVLGMRIDVDMGMEIEREMIGSFRRGRSVGDLTTRLYSRSAIVRLNTGTICDRPVPLLIISHEYRLSDYDRGVSCLGFPAAEEHGHVVA